MQYTSSSPEPSLEQVLDTTTLQKIAEINQDILALNAKIHWNNFVFKDYERKKNLADSITAMNERIKDLKITVQDRLETNNSHLKILSTTSYEVEAEYSSIRLLTEVSSIAINRLNAKLVDLINISHSVKNSVYAIDRDTKEISNFERMLQETIQELSLLEQNQTVEALQESINDLIKRVREIIDMSEELDFKFNTLAEKIKGTLPNNVLSVKIVRAPINYQATATREIKDTADIAYHLRRPYVFHLEIVIKNFRVCLNDGALDTIYGGNVTLAFPFNAFINARNMSKYNSIYTLRVYNKLGNRNTFVVTPHTYSRDMQQCTGSLHNTSKYALPHERVFADAYKKAFGYMALISKYSKASLTRTMNTITNSFYDAYFELIGVLMQYNPSSQLNEPIYVVSDIGIEIYEYLANDTDDDHGHDIFSLSGIYNAFMAVKQNDASTASNIEYLLQNFNDTSIELFTQRLIDDSIYESVPDANESAHRDLLDEYNESKYDCFADFVDVALSNARTVAIMQTLTLLKKALKIHGNTELEAFILEHDTNTRDAFRRQVARRDYHIDAYNSKYNDSDDFEYSNDDDNDYEDGAI